MDQESKLAGVERVAREKLRRRTVELERAEMDENEKKNQVLQSVQNHPKHQEKRWIDYTNAIKTGSMPSPGAGVLGKMIGRSQQGKIIEQAHDAYKRSVDKRNSIQMLKDNASADVVTAAHNNILNQARINDQPEALKRQADNKQRGIQMMEEKAKAEKERLTQKAANLGITLAEYKKDLKEAEQKRKADEDKRYAEQEEEANQWQAMGSLMGTQRTKGGKRKTKCRKRNKRCKTTKRKKTNNKSKRRKKHQKKSTKKAPKRR